MIDLGGWDRWDEDKEMAREREVGMNINEIVLYYCIALLEGRIFYVDGAFV